MEKLSAIITRIERSSPDIATLYFTLSSGGTLTYTAGQYITVFFDDTSTPEGKAYSLSSAPHESEMSITVKKIGEYSGRLHALRIGDEFQISQAYGFFNPLTSKQLICISAGCGIAPIWSILKDELANDTNRIAHLFYSNKTIDDIAFHSELDNHQAMRGGFSVRHHITRQPEVPGSMTSGRISLDDCLQAAEDEAMYLICGSLGFVRDMWKGLIERGVAPALISTETFFE